MQNWGERLFLAGLDWTPCTHPHGLNDDQPRFRICETPVEKAGVRIRLSVSDRSAQKPLFSAIPGKRREEFSNRV
jgi:hypothetical protein